jgi:D-amino-acid dehydrogenase
MAEDHTLIVGGGIVGLSIAYYLARSGRTSTILDDSDLSTSASTGNAGIIALGHPPLPRPGLVRKGLKWMFDPTSPLYVPLRLDPALIQWMWQFRAACRPDHFERSMRLLAELGHATGECFREMLDEDGMDCEHLPNGWLEVYRTDETREELEADARLMEAAGYTVEHLDRAALLEAEPAFAESVRGALNYTESFSIDPGAFLSCLATACEQRGSTILRNARVDRFEHRHGRIAAVTTDDGRRFEGDTVVLAAGCWTTPLARSIGVRVPMQAGKGYHVHVPAIDPPLTTAAVCVEQHVAVTPMGDRIRLAGTVELSGLNLDLHPRRVEMLGGSATEYLPAIDPAAASTGWCGLRPCTADGLPAVGWAPGLENLFIATGHARMGMTLGPITGKLIAEWMLDGRPSMDISAMDPGRFA